MEALITAHGEISELHIPEAERSQKLKRGLHVVARPSHERQPEHAPNSRLRVADRFHAGKKKRM